MEEKVLIVDRIEGDLLIVEFGDSYIKDGVNGWTNIKPIDKDECTSLFSRTLLGDNSFTKNEDESIEVTYELKIT